MTRKQIVILGGGTGGTMAANRLRRRFEADEAEIHVVDRDDRHVYQPGLLFVPFGLTQVEEIVRPRIPRSRRNQSARKANSSGATGHLIGMSTRFTTSRPPSKCSSTPCSAWAPSGL